MMEAKELVALIARGENSRTQFKRSQDVTNARSLAGEMAALANSKGGKILVGVDDTGSINGLSREDVRRINQLISSTATDCVRPSINPETENIIVDDRLVIVITVPEGISKPYADNEGVFWVKSGADKRRVTSREEIQRMFQSSNLVHADEVPVKGTSPDDIDLDRFRAFFKKHYGEPLEDALDQAEIPFGQLLNNLGLARGDSTSPGCMLFGRNPRHRRHSSSRRSFLGTTRATDTGTVRTWTAV